MCGATTCGRSFTHNGHKRSVSSEPQVWPLRELTIRIAQRFFSCFLGHCRPDLTPGVIPSGVQVGLFPSISVQIFVRAVDRKTV